MITWRGAPNYKAQLENWLIWSRIRDDRPRGHDRGQKTRGSSDPSAPVELPPPVVIELDALSFERLVRNMPRRHKEIFIAKALETIYKGRRKFVLLNTPCHTVCGLSRTTFNRRLDEAVSMIKRDGGLL